MRNEHGTALLEMIVLGFAVVGMALPLFLSVAALADARTRADVAATDAALWVARHGSLPDEQVDGVDLIVEESDDVVSVRATTTVEVLGFEFTSVSASVGVDRRAWVSPYRSGR